MAVQNSTLSVDTIDIIFADDDVPFVPKMKQFKEKSPKFVALKHVSHGIYWRKKPLDVDFVIKALIKNGLKLYGKFHTIKILVLKIFLYLGF